MTDLDISLDESSSSSYSSTSSLELDNELSLRPRSLSDRHLPHPPSQRVSQTTGITQDSVQLVRSPSPIVQPKNKPPPPHEYLPSAKNINVQGGRDHLDDIPLEEEEEEEEKQQRSPLKNIEDDPRLSSIDLPPQQRMRSSGSLEPYPNPDDDDDSLSYEHDISSLSLSLSL